MTSSDCFSTTFSRRKLFISSAALLPHSAFPSDSISVWIDITNGVRPLLGGYGHGARLGEGQVGVMGPNEIHVINGTLVPRMISTPQGDALLQTRALHNVRFDADLERQMATGVRAEQKHYALTRIMSEVEPSTGMRITPLATLIPVRSDAMRLQLLIRVDVDLPGVRSFAWRCQVDTADVFPVLGPQSWTEEGARLLHERFSFHAPHALRVALIELERRQGGTWKEPFEASEVQKIGLHTEAPGAHFFYVALDETDTHFLLVRVRAGYPFGDRRFVFDKKLVSSRAKA